MTVPGLTDKALPRILFMGTPSFSVPSLEVLCAAGFKPAGVVTGPDKRRGRGRKIQPTAIKQAARRLGIATILQPDRVKDPEFTDAARALDCDIQVVVAFRILPQAVFSLAKLGAFNLHASLLPRYRGAAPINRALMAGEETSGVTTFFLQQRVDTGSMILQWPTHIHPDETAGELHDRLSLLGARAVLESVRRIASGGVTPRNQDHSLATPAPKIFREDCRVDWQQHARVVHNHCRGLSPFPGAWTTLDGRDLKILRTRVCEGSGKPGMLLTAHEEFVVACGNQAVEVLELQLQGKRRLRADEFIHGNRCKAGMLLV